MAYFVTDFPNDIIAQLAQLGERSEIVAQLMLDDSSQILADAIEQEIRAKHKDSGELADSIECSEPYKDKNDIWSVYAYPAGKTKKKRTSRGVYARSRHGTTSSGKALFNADKLYFIEYGTSKQRAKPFIKRVANNASGAIYANMQKIYNEEVSR